MENKAQAFFETARRAIREIKDPVELQRQLQEMVEAEFPVAPAFKDGEVMLMYEFERRFKTTFCHGIEPHFAQWPVRVDMDEKGNVTLRLGKTLDQIKAELNG